MRCANKNELLNYEHSVHLTCKKGKCYLNDAYANIQTILTNTWNNFSLKTQNVTSTNGNPHFKSDNVPLSQVYLNLIVTSLSTWKWLNIWNQRLNSVSNKSDNSI